MTRDYRFWTLILLILCSSAGLAQNREDIPYINIVKNWPGPRGQSYSFNCPEGDCGNELTVIEFGSGPQSGGDKAEGIAHCMNSGLKPLAIFQVSARAGGPGWYRTNMSLCARGGIPYIVIKPFPAPWGHEGQTDVAELSPWRIPSAAVSSFRCPEGSCGAELTVLKFESGPQSGGEAALAVVGAAGILLAKTMASG
jgi:hypothetical protein